MIARFKDIARFTALTSDFLKTTSFVAYHIPAILPIAIPLSALIASLILFQRFSRSFELIAWRASGLSLPKILAPLLALSLFLTLIHFLIVAEIAPYCRREGKTLIYHETTENPLLLLQRQKLVKLKHAYLNMEVQDDVTIRNLTLIVPNDKHLSLISAKKLWIQNEELQGRDLAIISYLDNQNGFDSLFIEHQSSMSTAAPLLSQALKKNRPRLDLNALSFKTLNLWRKPRAAMIEKLRRISLSLAVFSFTLLGCTFGIEEARRASKKNMLFAMLLTLTMLISYLLGKEFKNYALIAFCVLIVPHPLIWISASIHLYRISRGRLC